MSGRAWSSSIGTKTLMAGTGLLLLLFVIGHLLGNLQIFLGREALNAYAHKLRSLPEILWVARIGLIVVFLVHVATAVRLTRLNRSARPVRYRVQKAIEVGYTSRTLILTGAVILAFVAYHLLHFTLGLADPETFHVVDAAGNHDVYSMVLLGLSKPPVAGAYLVAVLLLGAHLHHGIASLFQTLGWNAPKHRPLISRLGPLVALAIFVGYASIPLSIVLGILELPPGVAG